MDGKVWPQEPGVAGYIMWEVGKQRERNGSVQVAVFFPCFIRTPPVNGVVHI